MNNSKCIAKLVLSRTNPNLSNSVVTIGVPVFNQERIIARNLSSILENTSSNFEIIIIDDASRDLSLQAILNVFNDEIFEDFPNLANVRIYRNKTAKFETYCDNLAISKSRSNYFIEIQSDMFIEQPSYDQRLIEAITAYDDLIAISGRGVHKIQDVVNEYAKTAGSDRSRGKTIPRHIVNVIRTRIRTRNRDTVSETQSQQSDRTSISIRPSSALQKDFLISGAIGQLGPLMETKLEAKYIEARNVFVGESIMRGPLLIDLKKLGNLGTWDQGTFFQAYDDHDFCLRAYVLQGYRVGYVPIGFASPSQDGTTRKKKSLISEFSILRNLVKIRRARKESELYLATINGLPNLPAPEVRNF